jgi:hypothetical protein
MGWIIVLVVVTVLVVIGLMLVGMYNGLVRAGTG